VSTFQVKKSTIIESEGMVTGVLQWQAARWWGFHGRGSGRV
jgi:hypothetical protein